MAFKELNAAFCVEVPQLDGAVITRGEDSARCGIDADRVDPVAVAAESEGGFVFKVPDFGGFVDGAADEDVAVEM